MGWWFRTLPHLLFFHGKDDKHFLDSDTRYIGGTNFDELSACRLSHHTESFILHCFKVMVILSLCHPFVLFFPAVLDWFWWQFGDTSWCWIWFIWCVSFSESEHKTRKDEFIFVIWFTLTNINNLNRRVGIYVLCQWFLVGWFRGCVDI
jgi:hypothetical protein